MTFRSADVIPLKNRMNDGQTSAVYENGWPSAISSKMVVKPPSRIIPIVHRTGRIHTRALRDMDATAS